jgi:hypothetical protein
MCLSSPAPDATFYGSSVAWKVGITVLDGERLSLNPNIPLSKI